MRHELRMLLDTFIATLPEDEREILDMRLCGLTVPDMADALDLPIGTVSSRMRDAEATLTVLVERHQARQRQQGVVVLPLVISDIIERVGADIQYVPAGMRERIGERLRARLAGLDREGEVDDREPR